MLDWSYRLLSDQERETLRRVSAFSGDFTLSEAIAISAGNGIADIQVVSAVGGLVAKSLATSDVTEAVTRYRLHETTRAYACAKMCRADPPTALAAA
jgi:predicted ATPase